MKDVRDFIARVASAEQNTEGLDSRIARFERELEEYDHATDRLLNERDISATEAKTLRETIDALEAELDGVSDIANNSPRVSLIVDYANTKRSLFKEKLKERTLSKRVDALKRMEAEGRANPDILAELTAKEIELGMTRSNIDGLRVKADRLEPMVPTVRQEVPDFVSAADRAGYIDQIVNDIFDQLTGRARRGAPSYDMVMTTRGPMKERSFNIPDELIEDFLEQDIELIARRYARVMAADVELARMQESAAKFFVGMSAMTALGIAAYVFKTLESGRELSTNPGTWIAEGLDRSGIFSVAFELNGTFEKLGGPGLFTIAAGAGRLVNSEADMKQRASRFANRDAFGALLGPSFQLGTDSAMLLGIPARAMSGEFDLTPADINRMSAMTPFLTLPYWRWFIEGGFGFGEISPFAGVEPELKKLVEP